MPPGYSRNRGEVQLRHSAGLLTDAVADPQAVLPGRTRIRRRIGEGVDTAGKPARYREPRALTDRAALDQAGEAGVSRVSPREFYDPFTALRGIPYGRERPRLLCE